MLAGDVDCVVNYRCRDKDGSSHLRDLPKNCSGVSAKAVEVAVKRAHVDAVFPTTVERASYCSGTIDQCGVERLFSILSVLPVAAFKQ